MTAAQPAVALSDAYAHAKTALGDGETDRAIAIAEYLLRSYPHYLDAYQLLGEANVERDHPDEALRFFNHILSADPQSVLALVGRATVLEDRGQIDAAIDAYERALEIEPSHPELRTGLLRLYKSRYGSAGATIRTTPGGLAYGHLRGGRRGAAISELGYVAQTRLDRWDLDVALAEALWRNEQLDEAAAAAAEILASHTTCVKCHWLLGYLHWTAGRTEIGRQYLTDAVALDPTYRVAQAIWDATPWPLDGSITRGRPALVPDWSPQDLLHSGIDLSLSPPALDDPAARPRRLTTPLGRLPGRVTAPLGPLDFPPEEATGADLQPPVPLPLDLDWFDEWAASTEATPDDMLDELSYNVDGSDGRHTGERRTAQAASEEGKMPSYKEDDDQGRQFPFDWEGDYLPDYMMPFMPEEAEQAVAVAEPGPADTRPVDVGSLVQDGTPDSNGDAPLPWAKTPGTPRHPLDAPDLPDWLLNPYEQTPADGFDFSGVQPFDSSGRQPSDLSAETTSENGAVLPGDQDDFIDFLSASDADTAEAWSSPAPAVSFSVGEEAETETEEADEPTFAKARRREDEIEQTLPPKSEAGPLQPVAVETVEAREKTQPLSFDTNAYPALPESTAPDTQPEPPSSEPQQAHAAPSGEVAPSLAPVPTEPVAAEPTPAPTKAPAPVEPPGFEPQQQMPVASLDLSSTTLEPEPAPTEPESVPAQVSASVEPITPPEPPSAPAGGGLDELLHRLEANPTDDSARLALAIGYAQRDDITRAAAQYRELINNHTAQPHLLEIVAANLHDLVESQPDDPVLHRLLGDAYMKQGLIQAAIDQYQWLVTNGGT